MKSDPKRKPPPAVRWLLRNVLRLALRHIDLDGDGKVDASEVLAFVLDVLEPILLEHSRVREDR